MKLTKPQFKVLKFVNEYQERFGGFPTVREICTGLGYKSPASAFYILKALKKKGVEFSPTHCPLCGKIK